MSLSALKPPKPITLFCSDICPWAARTWIALVQANVEFEYVEIDLVNKPDWFLRDVNPGGKVPTLKYGDQFLIESAITTEFIADLFPESNLHLKDPFEKAESRLLADRFMEFIFPIYREGIYGANVASFDKLFPALEKFQPYLKGCKPFFGGSQLPTLPEILVAPFIARMYAMLESEHLDSKYISTLKADPAYSTFNAWAENLIDSPGVKGTFLKEKNVELVVNRFFKK
ncbi:thioredoxin-like protein [Dipodascopsis uninucleata]